MQKKSAQESTQDPKRRETVLFAQLIELLTQNAVMMLGGMADRSGRQMPPDLNHAELFIEILSVLKKKTQGNLTADESKMLSNTLFQLQSAFAEVASKSGEFEKARKATDAVQAGDEETDIVNNEADNEAEEFTQPPVESQAQPSQARVQPKSQAIPVSPGGLHTAAGVPAESKVKFTKKYG